jgi:hypothetical protein
VQIVPTQHRRGAVGCVQDVNTGALGPSGSLIAFGDALSLFIALALKPAPGISLCPEAALDSTMTAGKGDLHRESSGIIVGDDLVIAHSSKHGTAAAPFQSWLVSQFENSPTRTG